MDAKRIEKQIAEAMRRGDRIAAVNLAQRAWHAGDIRRTAIVGLRWNPARSVADQNGL